MDGYGPAPGGLRFVNTSTCPDQIPRVAVNAGNKCGNKSSVKKSSRR